MKELTGAQIFRRLNSYICAVYVSYLKEMFTDVFIYDQYLKSSFFTTFQKTPTGSLQSFHIL